MQESSGGAPEEAVMPEPGVAAPGHRLPGGTYLGVVRLQVADLERSEEFYHRVLGLDAVGRRDGVTLLRAPGAERDLLELVERQEARPVSPRGRIGLYHYAVLLPDRTALAAFVAHAAKLGLRLGMSDHLVSEAVYFSDPDGLGIEVYADRLRSSWRWRDGQLEMGTSPLDVADLLADAPKEPFRAVPARTVVGHLHLHVGDLTEAERFYHGALGLDKTVWSYPGALFLSAGGYHHHLGLNTWAAGAPPAGPDDARLLSWSLELPARDAVEAAARRLESAGYAVAREDGRVRTADPWGTTLELTTAPAA